MIIKTHFYWRTIVLFQLPLSGLIILTATTSAFKNGIFECHLNAEICTTERVKISADSSNKLEILHKFQYNEESIYKFCCWFCQMLITR